MKNRNLLLTVAVNLGMISGLTAQNVPSYVPTNGLVGWWPFNGNANDESGNGNIGSVNGTTPTNDRFGNSNSAYNFNGINNFIEVQNNQSLQLTSSMSFSLWYNFDSLNFDVTNNIMQGRLIDKVPNSTGQGYWSTLVKANSPTSPFYCNNNNSSNASISFGITSGKTTCTSRNQWYNLLGTFNNGFYRIFLNGNLVDSNNVAGPNIPINNLSLYFGYAHNTNDPRYYYRGKLDDIAIWNRALSLSEITQLYNQGICKTSITVTDTLLIHTGITSYNPVAYQNTLKVWPNPGNQDITIDAGNLALMQGWKIRISNAQGVHIYPSGSQNGLINQQQQTLDMSGWGGNGLYFLYLIDPQNNIQEVKKIVLAP